jgi:hemicentin
MSESDFTIDWFLDGWPIRDALFTTEFQLANDRQTLIITSADLRSIGDYMCLVRNEAGTDRLIARVDVTVDPYFERQPTDIGVPPTKAAQFYCSAGGNPKPTIQWFFESNKTGEEREIRTSGDVFVSDERLIIVHTRRSDEGFYYCVATSGTKAITSRRAFLTVYSIPAFTTNLPTEVNLEELERVELPCTASGIPTPFVTWTRDGVVVGEQEGARVRKLPSGTLLIENGARDDEGLYTCRVANAAGEQFHNVQLNIFRRPVVQLTPERVIAEVDDPVRFVCVAEGAPKPDIVWLFKGRTITENDRVIVTKTGDLLIAFVKAWDEGYYSCLARNRIGQSEDRGLLEVVGFKGNTSAPEIRQDFITRNISRNQGDEVTMSCLISAGAPTPTVQWLKEGIVLQPTLRIRIDEVGVLKILDIREEDGGHYTCIARNSDGVVQSTTTLLVREMPEVNLPPITPHVDPGQTVELTCEATGTPTPRIEWLRDNSALIADGERIIIEGNQLTINNARPSDSGEYMCLAINAAGQASHGIKVTVTENDEPQFNIRPTSQIVLVGEPVLLDCRVTGTPEIMVEWRKNGQILETNDAVSIDMFAGMLSSVSIEKAEESDSGIYSCFASNSFGTAEVEVEVFVTRDESCIPTPDDSPRTATGIPAVNRTLPTGETAPQEGSLRPIYDGNQIRAASGHTVILNCTQSVSPNSHLNHVWLHNNLDIDIDEERFKSLSNGTLIISGVGAEDGGSYECLFSMNQTVASNAFRLFISARVLASVEFVIQPRNQTVLVGSTSVITCMATADDKPIDIVWYFGEEIVSETGILVIDKTTLADKGEYLCALESKEFSDSAYLDVQAAPSFIKRPADVIINDNNPPSRVVLECQADGVPEPNYTWFKGNQSLETNFNVRLGQLQIVISNNIASVIILPPYTEDLTGKYTCVVENNVGRIQSSATVQVSTSDDLSSTASCNCQLKTRKRRIQIGDCVSFNEHNENYCEGFCETSVYPTYTSTEDARKCCSPGVNSVKSVILMRCNELGHEISRAVEVDAIRSCECHLC